MAELNPVVDDPMDDLCAIEPLEGAPVSETRTLGHRSLKRLIDFLFLPSTHVMPNERKFAESLLLRDWDGLPDIVLERLSQRLADAVEAAPRLALKLASCERIRISEPVLKNGALNDMDIVDIAHKGSEEERLIIARRHNLSPIVSALLVEIGGENIVKAVLMNAGAILSSRTLGELIAKAKGDPSLQNALLFRSEISAPDAMELFWHVSSEVREYILLTYLCDQRSITGFLHEDTAWQEHQSTLCPAEISDERLKVITKLMVSDDRDSAIDKLAQNAHLAQTVASKILKDKGGEAFLVAAKAMGASRAGVNEALMRFVNSKPCLIGNAKKLEFLKNLFDRLSRDQALVALQYWS